MSNKTENENNQNQCRNINQFLSTENKHDEDDNDRLSNKNEKQGNQQQMLKHRIKKMTKSNSGNIPSHS